MPISNINPIPLPYCSNVRHERYQIKVKDLKNETERYHENTVLNNNDHSLQENITTYIW